MKFVKIEFEEAKSKDKSEFEAKLSEEAKKALEKQTALQNEIDTVKGTLQTTEDELTKLKDEHEKKSKETEET